MSIICSKCGATVHSGKFCSECGERMSVGLVLPDNNASQNNNEKNNDITKYSIFDCEKRYDGTYIIKKLMDPYAFIISIPDSAIAIENGAFENSRIMEVFIPNGVRFIGERAFANCKHLKNINIPESVVQIGKEAFLNCEKLDLVIPSNIDLEEDVLKGTLSDTTNKTVKPQQNEVVPTPTNDNANKKLYKRNGKNVTLGEFPQTIKDKNVMITDKTDSRGYYLGSDGCYYAKQTVVKSTYLKFSNGETLVPNQDKYFKVEPIKWQIIYDTNDNYCTILTDKAIDVQMFDNSNLNYEKSYLRKYLNNEFLNIAFSSEQIEKCLAYVTVNSTDYDKEKYSFKDRLFILTYDEVIANYYGLNSNYARVRKPTDYALAKGVITSGENALWWLRTVSSSSYGAIRGILGDGGTSDYFAHPNNNGCGVVPAVRVKLI